MRKVFLVLITLALFFAPAARAAEAKAPETDIVITTGSFVYQLSRMEAEPAAYAGKIVSIEGLFDAFTYGESDTAGYRVYRYYPGDCCAVNEIGLEVAWPDEGGTYPAEGTWVLAQGVLESYEVDGVAYLRVNLTRLEEAPETDGEFFVLE